MKLTKVQLIKLARAYPTFEPQEIVELAEYIEDNHTLRTIEAMLTDGKYIEPALRAFYEELVQGAL